jgi:hypothetical protein
VAFFNQPDSIRLAVEIIQFTLIVLELRVLEFKFLKRFLGLFLPKPLINRKVVKELSNLVFGALNRTSKKQNNFNNFLILGNPIVEGFSLVLRNLLLVPVLHLLGRFQNMRRSSVNRSLHLLERGFED